MGTAAHCERQDELVNRFASRYVDSENVLQALERAGKQSRTHLSLSRSPSDGCAAACQEARDQDLARNHVVVSEAASR